MSLETVYALTCDVCLVEKEGVVSEDGLWRESLREGWEEYVDKDGYECHRCPRCSERARK